MALRLVSKSDDYQAGPPGFEFDGTRDDNRELTKCLSSIQLPSKDVLVSLFLALKLEEWRMRFRSSSQFGGATYSHPQKATTLSSITEGKRIRLGADSFLRKRCRLS